MTFTVIDTIFAFLVISVLYTMLIGAIVIMYTDKKTKAQKKIIKKLEKKINYMGKHRSHIYTDSEHSTQCDPSNPFDLEHPYNRRRHGGKYWQPEKIPKKKGQK